MRPQFAETLQRQVWLQEFAGPTKPGGQGFRREISAAHGAFHRGGPAGARPISREEKLCMPASCAGRQRSTPGSGENVALTSLITVAFRSFASRVAGRTLGQFAPAEIDDFLTRLRHQIIRSADHKLQILAVGQIPGNPQEDARPLDAPGPWRLHSRY